MFRLLRQWAGRAGRAAPGPRPPAFDAVIDLGLGGLPPWVSEAAAAAARVRLAGWPGARLLRVRPGAGSSTTVRLYAPGTSMELEGPAWSALRARLLATLEGELAGFRRPEPSPAERGRMPGFAEADVRRADGLAALAALAALASTAATSRAPTPQPPSPHGVAPGDVDRLARLLGLVLPREDRAAATRAVQRLGSYAGVLAAPASELLQVSGFGPHAVAAVRLMHEAAIRLSRAGIVQRPLLDERGPLLDYLAAVLAREPIEQFRVLFLDAGGMLLADEVQARGTVNHTPVYPREVVRRALELGATALVLVHNHPSGDPTPSGEDMAMTRLVGLAASALSLGLRDHIIVGNGRTLSFRDEGLLPGTYKDEDDDEDDE